MAWKAHHFRGDILLPFIINSKSPEDMEYCGGRKIEDFIEYDVAVKFTQKEWD
jgi:hypothetical protein